MGNHGVTLCRDALPQCNFGYLALIGSATHPVNPVMIHAAVAMVHLGKTGASIAFQCFFYQLRGPCGWLHPLTEMAVRI
jgi:hypothetical protein